GVNTLITYDKLWITMKEKDISQYRLIKYYGFSAGQIGRLKKNMYVSTHTLETLCSILNCNVEDIVEYRPDSFS
ncbi:MAG: helix-turn-helix transcriptional regulator, partial [Clostridium sp.]